jgi:hypothetical protein
MHGVGLLRISLTPVTVDTEEYVVFVNGWLAPLGFASWVEANAYFLECMNSEKKYYQARLKSGIKRASGPRPGLKTYNKAIKNLLGVTEKGRL